MTQFVKVRMKHYCIKDKKRYTSSELKNKCGKCSLSRCNTGEPIERLKALGVI